MTKRPHQVLRLFLSLTSFALTGCSQLQQIGQLREARSRYYNLRDAGVSSFSCEVAPHWETFLAQINQTGVETPWDRYLKQAHLSFTEPLVGQNTITWTNDATPPPGKEQLAATMQRSFHDMVEGYLQASKPYLNGTLLPAIPIRAFTRHGDGFDLVEDDQKSHVLLTLDKGLVVRHLSMRSASMHVESDLAYTNTPKGLVITHMDSQVQQPPEGTINHSVIDATYAETAGVLLPSSFTVTTADGTHIPMRFHDCQVSR